MSKVFLSYSHKDETFVTELFQRLTRDGVECFFDKESIGWGDNWVLRLEKELKQCDFIVFVLTPGFCKSMWSQKERTAVMAGLRPGMSKRIKPLLLKECKDQLPLFFQDIQFIDVSTSETFEKNYPSICSQLGGVYMEEEEEEVNRTQLPRLCRLPSKHRVPYRSLGDRFAGRVADLWKIDEGPKKGPGKNLFFSQDLI